MVAGVAYGSLSGFGCGTGASDWRMRSSWTFFIGSPPRRHSLVERARPRLAHQCAPRRDDRGEIGRPGPQQRQETLGFEPLQFRMELIEAHPPKDLEELVLLEPQRTSLREEFEDLLTKPTIHGPRLFGPERSIDHLDSERVEGVLDELAGPRGCERVRGVERLGEPLHVFVGEGPSVREVLLVHEDVRRHVSRDLEGGGDPFVECVQAVLARDVAHGHKRLRAVVVRLPDQILEPPLAHDVEDRQVHLDLDVRTVRHGQLDLADPCPDRVHVRLLVLVEDEPADEGGLPDPALPQEGQLRFHATDARHRRTQAPPHSEGKYKLFRRWRLLGRDRRPDPLDRDGLVIITNLSVADLPLKNWNQNEWRWIYPAPEARTCHATSPRWAADPRAQLANRVVEVSGPLLVAGPRPMGLPSELASRTSAKSEDVKAARTMHALDRGPWRTRGRRAMRRRSSTAVGGP